MSFDTREQSEFLGQPVEMYKFTVGSQTYSITSSDIEIINASLTYQREPLELANIVQSLEREQNEIILQMPRDFVVAKLFVEILPPYLIDLTIFRRHVGDSETRAWWNGSVVGVNFKPGSIAEMRCVPLSDAFRTQGLSRQWQVTCNHMLYDPDTCTVNPDSFKVTTAVSAISENTITSAMFALQPDGYYTGGFVRRVVNGDLRFVIGHVGSVLTLWAPFDGMAVTEQVDAFAGCAHDIITCNSKFGNKANHGGFTTVPPKNLFLGSFV